MLRTLVIAFALGAPGVAVADQFPQSALHAPVVADNGVVVGHVNAVERDASGRIVAVEIDGLEPPSAPMASRDLVAEERRARATLTRAEPRREGGARQARTR
jgi:hypothetical protein